MRLLAVIVLLLLGPATVFLFGDLDLDTHWSEASMESSGIAPHAWDENEAIVQVYAARAFNWRGAFGTHSWIATKEKGAEAYKIYQVVGWNLRAGRSVVSVHRGGAPDFRWYNAKPEILVEHRGDEAAAMISRIDAAVRTYPYPHAYEIWPGPNSNTFIAWVAREVPELGLDLPPTALGKDYLPNGDWYATLPSGSGWQISLNGLLGLGVGLEEGIEINLLGLAFGLDFNDLALRLPGWGRIGLGS